MSQRTIRRSSPLLILGLVTPELLLNPVAAHEVTEETPYELEEMVIEGRAQDLTGYATTASQGRVGQVELEKRPILRPGEVLETIPGLMATQHSGSGKANQYFLRGFNLDHGTDFSTTLDGVPLNLRTHGHGQGWLDTNFLIPELIDYVEYKKGVYYPEVGDFSSAGTSAITTADELDKGIASLGIGSSDFYRGLLANSHKLGDGSFLYGLEYQYYNGPWDVPQNMDKYNALLKYTHGTPLHGFSLSFTGYHSTWTSTDQVPQRAVDQGIISELGALDPTDGGDIHRYSLGFEWWHHHENASTTANAYMVYSDLSLFSNFTFNLDDPVNGDQFEQVDERYLFGGKVAHNWQSQLFTDIPTQHELGLEVRHDHIPDVALHHTKARQRLGTTRKDRVEEFSFGAYYRNETQWFEKLRTIAGLRGDFYYFDVNSSLDANSGSDTAGIVSPKVGLVLGPWYDTEFYGNFGLGFHSNDARGVTISVDPTDGITPAQPVDPLVRSLGGEVGVRTTFIDGLNSTLSLWYLELDSELLFVGDAGGTEASRSSRRYGLEWANSYQVTDWLSLDADFTFTESEFTEPDPDPAVLGDEIPGAIDFTAAAGASIDLPNGIFGSLRVRHFGSRPLIEDNSVRSDPTTVVNLQTGYRLAENLSLHLDVLNLLDSDDHDIDYFYASRLPDALVEPNELAAGVSDIHFHPVEPRQFRGYVVWRF
jgi:hypothetical protein